MCATLRSSSNLSERMLNVDDAPAAVTSPFNFQRAQSFLATMATVHDKWRESRNSQGVREFSFTCRERLEKLLIHLLKMLLEILQPYEFYCFYLAKERLTLCSGLVMLIFLAFP